MSPADKYLNKKPVLGHLITLTISMIVVFSTYAINTNSYDKKQLNKTLDSKADIKYVDGKIVEHESKQDKIIEPIVEDITELKAEDKLIRVEFLEEVRLLRKDIMDIYKNNN